MNKHSIRNCAVFTLLGYIAGVMTCVILQAREDKGYGDGFEQGFKAAEDIMDERDWEEDDKGDNLNE